MRKVGQIDFPTFSGVRCLMMPYIQGDVSSVPDTYRAYADIISSVYLKKGDIGYLTIDESLAVKGTPHRGQRAKWGRALHTEAGLTPTKLHCWGGTVPTWGHTPTWGTPVPVPSWGSPIWGSGPNVTLDRDVRILLANNLDYSCAVWDQEHPDTSIDGDIGDHADQYPYEEATLMGSGEVYEIGIFTPHESLKVPQDFNRQFLRIVGSGVHGREPYFTKNPLMSQVSQC